MKKCAQSTVQMIGSKCEDQIKKKKSEVFLSFIVYFFNRYHTITYKASSVSDFLNTKSLSLLL